MLSVIEIPKISNDNITLIRRRLLIHPAINHTLFMNNLLPGNRAKDVCSHHPKMFKIPLPT